jgi:poly(3-hydroxybutyrate) depolymerase
MQDTITDQGATARRHRTITVRFGGVQREVALRIPSSYVPGTAMSAVFALHGGSGDASVMYDPDRQIASHAENDGFIAVFPNGLPKPERPNSTNYYWGDPINIAYMAFLMDELSMRYTIDTRRIYFIGFSGGAKLIYNLAADPLISTRIAGIGTVAGIIGGKRVHPASSPWIISDPSVTSGVPMPAYLVQGARDRRLPLAGGFDDDGEQMMLGFENKVAIWRNFTGALAEAPSTGPLPPGVTSRSWVNPDSGHGVVAVVDAQLAHHWPHWDVMDEFWRFFQRMPPR